MSRTRKPGVKAPTRSTKPTIVKVHAAKTHLSRLLQRVAHGGRVLIANGNQDPRFELVLFQPGPQQHAPRQFGALRGAVTVDQRFFEPLSAAELEAWER